ncbi:phosphodiester glycosidase family protein [Sphaerisporangium perillae]|uniref:phosphodiester glycosidase family protein n=1 Tax=Sphaerisporangium perillae TaxID=2935860 RepID=UPI00200BED9B|nr:phosphodiester glycosidase family protein [Sphaerisporangium perillae]
MRNLARAVAVALVIGLPGVAQGTAQADAPRAGRPDYQTTVPGVSVEAGRTDRTVAPGIVLTTFDTFGRDGWTRAHVLNADLSGPGVDVGLVGGRLTETQPLSKAADARSAVAAVNGDYYDINDTNAVIGPEVRDGELRKATSQGRTVAAVGEDKVARLANALLEGTVTVAGTGHPVASLNTAAIPANAVTVFTDQWGPGNRTLIPHSGALTELVVTGGAVTAVNAAVTNTPVPDGGLVVVGQGAAAATLAAAKPGDAVALDVGLRTDSPAKLRTALGSGEVLVRDGQAIDFPPSTGNDAPKPRTAIGWADGGRRLLLVTVDGSANFSAGLSFDETAKLLVRLGAREAFMLDGGGSSDIVARTPGDAGVSVVNTPSDGGERLIPSGVGLYAAKGSGTPKGLAVRASAARVFPGLTVRVSAAGYDETYAPADLGGDRVRWDAGRLGEVRDGVLRAERSGEGDLTARAGRARGHTDLRVLGELSTAKFTAASLTLETGDSTVVGVRGYDADGFDAPVAARDADLEYDSAVVKVEARDDGSLTVTGLDAPGGTATVVTASVQGKVARLPVVVGLKRQSLAEFEAGETWAASASKAVASVAAVDGSDRPGAPAGNRALALRYDFTGTSGTSAAYAVAKPSALTLPHGTRRLGVWAYGDGKKHWLRATLRSQGTTNVPFTFAAVVDWTGWKWVEGTLPAGFSEPITLNNLYVVETSNLAKDAGELRFDALTALVGQEATADTTVGSDPFVLRQADIGKDRWRFAVMSDLHVSAAAGPSSFAAQQAAAALRQAVAAKPDFILINGDFVDSNAPADFAFAEQILKDNVPADIPVHWTPGNHESGATATGTLDAFLATGRPAHQVFDHKGTRFVLMNTTLGGLRISDWSQVPELRDELAKAEKDRSVKSLALVFHHPLHDPSGAGGSQFSDQLEAGLMEKWLAGFRESAGKPVAVFSGHAHTAAVTRVDGVAEINTPAVGKTPYSSPDKGGFFGWMLVGVDPRPGEVKAGLPSPATREWLTARVNPLFDKLSLSAPGALTVGASEEVSATGTTTAFGLTFPLRYPASVTWSGDRALAVAESPREAKDAARRHGVVAVLDLSAGRLTAVRPGQATLTVSSGDRSTSATVTVTAAT